MTARQFGDILEMDVMHVDIFNVKHSVLVIADVATTYCTAKVIPSTSSKGMLEALEEWCRYYGAPKVMFTDPDTAMLSDDFAPLPGALRHHHEEHRR